MKNLSLTILALTLAGLAGCSSAKGPTNPVNPTVRAVQPDASKTVIAAPDATKPGK